MVLRKVRSAIKKVFAELTNWCSYLRVVLLEENIKLGKNVKLGKNIVLKTTDDGSITIGNNVIIESNTYIYAQKAHIVIGENSFIGKGTQIVAKECIQIGKDCLISAYSIVRDSNHGIVKNTPINRQPHNIKPIVIEDDVWLGSHTSVTAGCKISKGVIVGANAVVTKNVEPYTMIGGVPAKFIKTRS